MDGSTQGQPDFWKYPGSAGGTIYLDYGYKTSKWVNDTLSGPICFMDDLENLEINHKNKLYGWANKNGRVLEFETINEKLENGRRLFTVAAVIDGKRITETKAFNKKTLLKLPPAGSRKTEHHHARQHGLKTPSTKPRYFRSIQSSTSTPGYGGVEEADQFVVRPRFWCFTWQFPKPSAQAQSISAWISATSKTI